MPAKKREKIIAEAPTNLPAEHPMSAESRMRFVEDISERAKTLDKRCLENFNKPLAIEVLWRYSQGESKKSISRVTDVDLPTIRRLCRDHFTTVEDQRKKMASNYAEIACDYSNLLRKRAEMLEDDDDALSQVSPDKLAVVVGVMTDKYSSLSGMNTITIEHRKGVTIDDAAATIAAIREKLAEKARSGAIEAEVISEV
jgi:hypothetical protein